jgi:acyl carrier protein
VTRMSDEPDVRQTVTGFLARLGKLPDDLAPDQSLFAGGMALDSLETAELSAALEAAHGRDPYLAGHRPATLDEIAAFYAVPPVA